MPLAIVRTQNRLLRSPFAPWAAVPIVAPIIIMSVVPTRAVFRPTLSHMIPTTSWPTPRLTHWLSILSPHWHGVQTHILKLRASSRMIATGAPRNLGPLSLSWSQMRVLHLLTICATYLMRLHTTARQVNKTCKSGRSYDWRVLRLGAMTAQHQCDCAAQHDSEVHYAPQDTVLHTPVCRAGGINMVAATRQDGQHASWDNVIQCLSVADLITNTTPARIWHSWVDAIHSPASSIRLALVKSRFSYIRSRALSLKLCVDRMFVPETRGFANWTTL